VIHHASVRGDHTAFVQKRDGAWIRTTYRDYAERCRAFAGGLLGEGLAPGDAVGIMGDNTPEWIIADVGAMLARAVPTGIYQTSTSEQVAHVAGHCDAKVLVLQNKSHWERVHAQRARLPALRRIVMINDAAQIAALDATAVSFDDFCARGRAYRADVDTRFSEIQEKDLATLIYTSGTTGPPKGAMLSHANMMFMARAAYELRGAPREESLVSYLPLSHIAEQLFSIHFPAIVGAQLVFAEALEKLKDALLFAEPTSFLGVPRVWEKFKVALEAKLGEATGTKAKVIAWSRAVGLEAGRERLAKGRLSPGMYAKYKTADRLFFSKLKAQLGLGRLRLAITGAAPISKEVLEFFLSCGIVIHEVYGQTESGGATTFNIPAPKKTRIGTAGLPLPGITLKIADDGEVLVKSPGSFMGYLKDELATRATLVDGWLHTGDVGEFDQDGFLRITDRKKDLIITSGGKNVAPQNIEKKLREIDGIGQAVVIGECRQYLTALLTLDPEQCKALAKANGWPESTATLAEFPAMKEYVDAAVRGLNAKLARYESIKKFVLLPSDFTIENDELTPTQKVKRNVVSKKYLREIESMYK
jgi:long-chain acyl-CoA synthetase